MSEFKYYCDHHNVLPNEEMTFLQLALSLSICISHRVGIVNIEIVNIENRKKKEREKRGRRGRERDSSKTGLKTKFYTYLKA
jgi:hypothetical protein